MRRVALLYISTNLFNARLNQNNLDSQTYLCIQSIVTSHIMLPLENPTVQLWENEESESGILVLLWK